MIDLSPGDSRCGCDGDYSVSAVVDLDEVNAVDFGGKLRGNNEEADELVKRLVNVYGEEKVYSVVVVNGEEEVKAVVGKYRHAWIVGKVSEEEAVFRVAEIFAKVFVNGRSEDGVIRNEFMPVGADGRIVLSFSLLNADPRDWIYDWYALNYEI
jgi:phosphatidylinositol glycan class S